MRLKLTTNLLLISTVYFLLSCSTEGGQKNLTMKERIKLKQYMVQGEPLYLNHCSNCHQVNGAGLKKLIPPLASNPHLIENRAQLACIAKYGMTGKIKLNGISFDENMPANLKLTNLQIAEILTYIGNNWGNELGIVDVASVDNSLKNCSNLD